MPFPNAKIDKEERTRPTESFFAGGNVRMINIPDTCGASRWMEQLLVFPLGAHDDAVDAQVTGVLPFIGLEDKGRRVVDDNDLDAVTQDD